MKPLEELGERFLAAIESCSDTVKLEELRLEFLGRKGALAQVRKNVDFKTLSPDERQGFGKGFNDLKTLMDTRIAEVAESFTTEKPSKAPAMDLTLPGTGRTIGAIHPVSLVRMELEDIFKSMGFVIETGYDVETEHYNFDALNMPDDHPARDMQDTFWLTNGMVLRTQTSAVQVRALEKYGAPMKMIAPGRCFRNEDLDANHENTFNQLEGLMVERHITVANLISVMKLLLSQIFKRDVHTRLRPGYFPFVEPGFELDINCLICGGVGCPTCKRTGWIELLPCGIIHPNVLRAGGVDPDKWSGFAFGLGLDRLVMMKYGIPDIRMLNSGDIRALSQFTAAV